MSEEHVVKGFIFGEWYIRSCTISRRCRCSALCQRCHREYMSRWICCPSFEWLYDLNFNEAEDGLSENRGNFCELFCANCVCQLACCLVLVLHENISMTGFVCETLQAVLKSVEVFKQDLHADDFKPATPNLVVSSPSVSEEVDEALFGLHRSLVVFAFEL